MNNAPQRGQRDERAPEQSETKPAGNAQFDRSQQSQRLDMPDDERDGLGEAARGSQPSTEKDNSHQPKSHDA
jgi:hypothetical protein